MAYVKIFLGSIKTKDGYLAISFLICVVLPDNLLPDIPILKGIYSGRFCF